MSDGETPPITADAIWASAPPAGRSVRPDELSHLERDRLGHFASRIREEEYLVRRRARWSWYRQRFADLMKVLRDRIGPRGRIPEGIDDAETIIRCFAYHFNARPDISDFDAHMTTWCLDHCQNWKAGWLNKSEIIPTILSAVRGRRRDLSAREVARELNVTWADRCRLGLRTIAACDLTPGEFAQRAKARKQEADRERQRAERRRAGVPTWADQTWQSREKPWVAMGISRATYYRQKRETVGSQIGEASNDSDATVSRSGLASPVVECAMGDSYHDASPRPPFPGQGADLTHAADLSTVDGAQQEDAAPFDTLRPCGNAKHSSHWRQSRHG